MGGLKFLVVARYLSQGDEALADAANKRGARIRGQELTPVQIDSWEERGAIEGKCWRHPGRPTGGSDVRYDEAAVEVAIGLAQALDQNPRSFNRAVLVVAGRGLSVGTEALRDALRGTYADFAASLCKMRKSRARLRLPSGVFPRRLDWFGRAALFELALDEVPITDAIDSLVETLGLPADLRSFPPDPEAMDYPDFVKILRSGLAFERLRDKARRAPRDDLDWASVAVGTFLSYAVTLARYVDLTSSVPPVMKHHDPAVSASGEHVFRTLVSGGRVLGWLLALGGAGSAEWLSAFAGPMLLLMLGILPERARCDLEGSIRVAASGLPRLVAVVSLVEGTTPDLRYLLSFDAAERLGAASGGEREALKAQCLAWSATHRPEASCLVSSL